MLPPAIKLPVAQARRFHRQALLLDTLVAGIDAVLGHHGYIQIDPINVCGRMHDHILRNRVFGYAEGDLMRHLHGNGVALAATERIAFEHHLPDTNVLVAFPLDAWPHLLAAMHRRSRRRGAWAGRLTPRERDMAERILAEIAEHGGRSSDQVTDGRRSRQTIWGSFSLAKSTLQKLFFHGRVLIARRENNRRVYDLPERILPASVRDQPEPDTEATGRWLTLLKLRQRRLVTLKRDELPRVEDCVVPITVADCPPLYCLREDAAILEEPTRPAPAGPALPLLLAPLDPLIYDRAVTSRLWGFDYTWEVYTPPARRKRGYYALPVLAGTEFVGHVEPKLDRERGKLAVVTRRVRRGHRIADALAGLAAFLRLK